jgi:hypothetical protein
MNTLSDHPGRSAGFELRFPSLFNEGRGLAFPCDAQGHVDIDRLPHRARNNYFCARSLIGLDYATPVMLAATRH